MNNATHPARSASTDYGRLEVKKYLHRNFSLGLLIAVVIHLVIVSSYYVSLVLDEDYGNVPIVSVKVMKYSDLGPPPSISSTPPPPSVNIAAAIKPNIGLPVPVPDADVSPEQTIATQKELSSAPSPALEDLGESGVQVTQDIVIDENEPGMDEFVPVEKTPQIVRKGIPDYPDIALRAGLEGTVWVKILVEKDGTPRKAVVIKSTIDIFNEAAIAAAMKFVFTPAVMNNGPVKVWVAIPFRFTLKDAS